MPSWKRTERKIAERLGGKRVPVTGRARGDVPDIDHDRFALEVKHRRLLPAWLYDAMNQAIASRKGLRIPVVILHQHGKHHDHDLVVLQLKDFMEIIKDKLGNGTENDCGSSDIL